MTATKSAFLTAYRALLIETMPWAKDAEKLERGMAAVVTTLTTEARPWAWDGPIARKVWRKIGCKGTMTLKGLRALSDN